MYCAYCRFVANKSQGSAHFWVKRSDVCFRLTQVILFCCGKVTYTGAYFNEYGNKIETILPIAPHSKLCSLQYFCVHLQTAHKRTHISISFLYYVLLHIWFVPPHFYFVVGLYIDLILFLFPIILIYLKGHQPQWHTHMRKAGSFFVSDNIFQQYYPATFVFAYFLSIYFLV